MYNYGKEDPWHTQCSLSEKYRLSLCFDLISMHARYRGGERVKQENSR